MVRLYPVKSLISDASSNLVAANFNNKPSASSPTRASKKCLLAAPNRFTGERYDRSIFGFESEDDDEYCAHSKGSGGNTASIDCNCATCSPTPIVIFSAPSSEALEALEMESKGRLYDNINLHNVDEFIEGGLLRSAHERSFLISQQIHCNGQSITGILAAIDVQDCSNNTLKRHERCVQDMQNKSLPGSPRPERKKPSRRAHLHKKPLDPIIVMYRDSESLTQLIQRTIECHSPVYTNTSSQVSRLSGAIEEISHHIWALTDSEDINELERAFASIDSLYIADGHHRTAAAYKAHQRASGEVEDVSSGDVSSESDEDSDPEDVFTEEEYHQQTDKLVSSRSRSASSPRFRSASTGSKDYCNSSRYISALLYSDAQMGVLSYNRCVTSITLPAAVQQANERERESEQANTLSAGQNGPTASDSVANRVGDSVGKADGEGNASVSSFQQSSLGGAWSSFDSDKTLSREERLFMREVSKEFVITPHSQLKCCGNTTSLKKHSRSCHSNTANRNKPTTTASGSAETAGVVGEGKDSRTPTQTSQTHRLSIENPLALITDSGRHLHSHDWCKCRMYTNKCDISMYIHYKWYNLSPIRDVRLRIRSASGSFLGKFAPSTNAGASGSTGSSGSSAPSTATGTADDSPLDSVSAQILSDRLLVPTLETDNPESENKVLYVDGREGLKGLMRRVDSGEAKVAFALERMSVAQIMEVADANQLLPAKATFFHPKPQTGIMLCLK